MKAIRRVVTALGVVGALTLGTMGAAGAEGAKDQGCSPGYWKNHSDAWVLYSPTATIGDTLPGVTSWNGLSSSTSLSTALNGGGGPSAQGATRILLRALVAAKLNTVSLAYPNIYVNGQFDAAVEAINTGDRAAMLAVASQLDAQNNLGCPLG